MLSEQVRFLAQNTSEAICLTLWNMLQCCARTASRTPRRGRVGKGKERDERKRKKESGEERTIGNIARTVIFESRRICLASLIELYARRSI